MTDHSIDGRLDSMDRRLDGLDDRLDKQSAILSSLGHHVRLMRRELIDLSVLGIEQELAICGPTEDKLDA